MHYHHRVAIGKPKFKLNQKVTVNLANERLLTEIASRWHEYDAKAWWYRVKSGRMFSQIFHESVIEIVE